MINKKDIERMPHQFGDMILAIEYGFIDCLTRY